MTTGAIIAADLVIAVLAAAGWIGGGVAAVAGRRRIATGLAILALVATLARAATTVALARAGWWFAAEKVVIAGPLTLAAAVIGVRRTPMAFFFAGYAATAAVLVTVLHGYPVSPAAALLAVAGVAAATTVTWRFVHRRPSRPGTVVAVAALVAGTGFAVTPATTPEPAHQHTPVARTEVGEPTKRFALTAGTIDGAWAFNGQVPGPELTATVGDIIEVTLRNQNIERGVTLHWHGYDVPNDQDGVPGITQDAVRPGQQFVYRFVAGQPGTYWYHTHSASDIGVRKGLYGTLIVHPTTPDTACDLTPPTTSGPNLTEPFVPQPSNPRPDSAQPTSSKASNTRAGSAQPSSATLNKSLQSGSESCIDVTVPVHTLDGRLLPEPATTAAAPGTPVRLRLINTDSTTHRYAVAGAPFRVIAIDGVDLAGPTPLENTALLIPAGGRFDVLTTAPAGLFVDGRLVRSTGTVPVAPGAWPVFDPLTYGAESRISWSRIDRSLTLVLDRGLDLRGLLPRYAHTVNGAADPDIPPQVVRRGEIVKLTIVNRSLVVHPWHLHGHHVLVLARNGKAPTGSPVWLDSFDLRPGEVWEVAFRADNPGMWANHCHNLPHAEAGMMLHLMYS
ncbi:multicopper oxidase family protein [Actinoplanes sp. TRM 88003]|uniref:Multicopper oxidase family protein n=1 Tax=Paractinoplanes aksuensis TaxID=2939490 RepID=A0ABT1DEI0_9ACTN|nr:multicopper oxidase domain-containing protein [Actinoplanes aksuensis]MCO8269204.1 multicopper oxidase family protein [Actinoplanes aksuensis]